MNMLMLLCWPDLSPMDDPPPKGLTGGLSIYYSCLLLLGTTEALPIVANDETEQLRRHKHEQK